MDETADKPGFVAMKGARPANGPLVITCAGAEEQAAHSSHRDSDFATVCGGRFFYGRANLGHAAGAGRTTDLGGGTRDQNRC